MILFALCHIFNFMKPLLQPPILFLLLIHLGLRVFAILSNTLLLNVDMSIKKKFGIYRCPQPNYDSFWGKVFSKYIQIQISQYTIDFFSAGDTQIKLHHKTNGYIYSDLQQMAENQGSGVTLNNRSFLTLGILRIICLVNNCG